MKNKQFYKSVIYFLVLVVCMMHCHGTTAQFKETDSIANWSVEIGLGTQQYSGPGVDSKNVFGISVDGRRMFNNKFGLFVRASVDVHKSENGTPNNLRYEYLEENIHIGPAVNTGRFLNFQSFTNKVTIINTLGLGYSAFKSDRQANQNMFSISLGTKLLYKIYPSVAIKLEHNRIGHIGQNKTLDQSYRIVSTGTDTFTDQFQVGIVGYWLNGKKHKDRKEHYDYYVAAPVVLSPELPPAVNQFTTVVSDSECCNEPELFKTIYFDENKHDLRQYTLPTLQEAVDFMNDNPEYKLTLTGFACTTHGTDEYNQTLSELRAKTTYDKLISAGIDSSRLSYVGKGKDKKYPGKSNSDLAKRVEIKAYK